MKLKSNLKKLTSKTSVKIFAGIFLITAIVLAYISIFAITTAQSEFQSATIRFIDGNLFLVKQSPVAPIEVIRKQFNDSLFNTLFFAGALGLLMSLIAGIIFSIIITQPLRELRLGISNLKKSKFKNKLIKTGESEFDQVIEEFNDLASELEYQETLRKDLISDVAHELKTPLTAVSLQIQGMIDGVFEPDRKRLQTTLEDVQRLNNLIDMLYEYTKLRTKISNKELQKVNINKLTEDVIKSQDNRLNTNNIKFNNNLDKDLKILTDKFMLERIILNIVDNSIKYSKGSMIEISNNKNTITIQDDGVGIPQEDLRKIFERFYRVEKSRNRITGGLGLGLAIVKEMVESLGGEIEAANNPTGKGICFIIKFPQSSL